MEPSLIALRARRPACIDMDIGFAPKQAEQSDKASSPSKWRRGLPSSLSSARNPRCRCRDFDRHLLCQEWRRHCEAKGNGGQLHKRIQILLAKRATVQNYRALADVPSNLDPPRKCVASPPIRKERNIHGMTNVLAEPAEMKGFHDMGTNYDPTRTPQSSSDEMVATIPLVEERLK